MTFSTQEIEKVINNLENEADVLLSYLSGSSYQIYQSKVNRFMKLIQENKVIDYIIKYRVEPSLGVPLELPEIVSEIEKSDRAGAWLELPDDMNKQIVYVLNIFKESLSKNGIPMWQYLSEYYHYGPVAENINKFNEEFVSPCIEAIKNKLYEMRNGQ